MAITIRPYKAADRDAFWAAVTVIYGDGMPIAPEREVPTGRELFVAMDGRECAGVFAELQFDTLRSSSSLPTGGLAMVGVVPERRHSGVGGELMRFALKDMRRRGKQLASLYAFSEAYYRQFGYEVCGSRLKISCPIRSFPKLPIHLPVKRLSSDEFQSVRTCYDAFARARSGLADRDDFLWGRLFGLSPAAGPTTYEKTVYAAGDPVEAYLVVKHDVTFHVEQEILELAWTTVRGYETMLGVMRSIAINKSGLIWCEPSDGPFYSRYMLSSAQTVVKLEKPIQYRVLDVPGVLRALAPACPSEFTLSVEDAELPDNVGPWRVKTGGGSVSVEPTGAADLVLDIRSFTQAYLGQPSIDDVMRNGPVVAKKEAAVEAFRDLMPPRPVYCLDMF